LSPKRSGHSIEARVYAEDPAKKFAPQPGHIQVLRWPSDAADLRIETGVREGLDVTPFYDPMIAKVVSHAATREAAIARLDAALAGTTLELVGPTGAKAGTNLTFLRAVLASPEFASGDYNTGFAETLAKTFKA
jgi:acetyl/propionyl-CoA carboxylase alpha subunit